MASKTAKEKGWSSGFKISFHILIGILFYLILILGTIYITKEVYGFSYQIFGTDTVTQESGTDIVVTIRKGDTTQEIAELLEYKNVVKNKNSFFIRAKLMVNDMDPILPGVYQLNTSMNYGDIIRTITDPAASLEESTK